MQEVQMLRTFLGCRPGKMKQELYFDSLKKQNRKFKRAACNKNLRTKNTYIVKKY